MGKKKAKAPKAPDPNVIIPLQTKANQDTFQYQLDQQRVNSSNPYGSSTWNKTPGAFNQAGYDAALAEYNAKNPRTRGAAPSRAMFEGAPTWAYSETLSPEQQQIFDATTASEIGQSKLLEQGTNRVADAFRDPYSGSADQLGVADYLKGLAADSTSDQFNRDVGDAVYSQQTRYLDPQNAREKQALEARLAEQGFVPGTPGYAQAMETFGDTTNRAYGAARDASILQGYGQGNTSLGQRTSIGNLLGNANAQMIAQQLALRNQPLNELNALRSGVQAQAPQTQAEFQTPGLQAPDITGAYDNQYKGQLDAYNSTVANNNAITGAIGQLGLGLATSGLFSGLGSKAAGLFGSKVAGGLANAAPTATGGFWGPARFTG